VPSPAPAAACRIAGPLGPPAGHGAAWGAAKAGAAGSGGAGSEGGPRSGNGDGGGGCTGPWRGSPAPGGSSRAGSLQSASTACVPQRTGLKDHAWLAPRDKAVALHSSIKTASTLGLRLLPDVP